MRTIFDEVKLNHLTVKNRIVRSATWEAIANPDGTPSEQQLQIYKELAEGDVGTIITGFTSVSDSDGYLGDGMARLSDDGQIPGWRRLTDARIDNFCDKTEEQIRNMKDAGFKDPYIGVESGDDYLLKLMNKGYDAKTAREQLEKLDSAGFSYVVNWIKEMRPEGAQLTVCQTGSG